MKTVESDMAALQLNNTSTNDISVRGMPSVAEISSISEKIPPPVTIIGHDSDVDDDDDDIAGLLLSILAEEMSQKKRKRNLKSAGPSTTGVRHRKALALALPDGEQKREKNRDSVKRSYYRKIETLDELRKHAEDLREQYMELLTQWEDKTEKERAEIAHSPSSFMRSYLELARLRDRLWMENTQLHEQFEDREKITYRFQRLFDVNYQLMNHSFAAPTKKKTPSVDAQRTFETFLASRHCMVTTETALGWTCSHVAKDNSFGYYFEKHFQRDMYKSVSEVVRTAWQTLTSPERHSKLYAPALHTRFHIMQQFDNNSYVLYRTMEKEGEDSITTALIIMSRIPHPNYSGCLIICKGLRREEHTLHVEFSEAIALQKKKEWRQSMYWLNIEEVRVGDKNGASHDGLNGIKKMLKVVHGGIMNNMGDRSRSFWLFQNLQIALRWEQNLGLGESLG
ncbi:unnamed protein product [Hyaloperonospora brassicae]|uniref:START domain-containing protein n=1 Tax=Hyaloperonospora brassicae TaxID=162125 RepID=A0AAV0TRR0_HYABA|nr:unnamed protein product [Hyaloperonospora brassicae]